MSGNASTKGSIGVGVAIRPGAGMGPSALGRPSDGHGDTADFATSEACKQLKKCMELSLANQNLLDQLFVARKSTLANLAKQGDDEFVD